MSDKPSDKRQILVNKAIWDGIVMYLQTLHKADAVDDVKMKFQGYYTLRECLNIWGIENK